MLINLYIHTHFFDYMDMEKGRSNLHLRLSYFKERFKTISSTSACGLSNCNKLKIYQYTVMLIDWSWSYCSWIYNYLCNQCLSLISCEFEPCSWQGVPDATLCDRVFQWLVTGWWFSPGTLISSTNKTGCHDNRIYLKYCWKWQKTP